MSRETTQWLNTNTLIGFGHKAWHFSSDSQGDEGNHYLGAIPAGDVARRLFGWEAVEVDLGGQLVFLPNGVPAVFAGQKAVAHGVTGEVFRVFQDGYRIHQHSVLLDWCEQITDGTVGISSAGILSGGAVAWVSVSLADTTVTPEGVEFLPYLMLFGSHNGKFATGAKRVITNVVCDNTMGTAMGEKAGGEYRVKHTRNSGLRITDAREALGIIMASGDAFSAQVKALCETTVTDAQWFAFLDVVAPVPALPGRGRTLAVAKQEDLRELWVRDNRVEPWRNTAYGVVQAMNTYTHHVQTVRCALRPERNLLGVLSGDFDALDTGTLATLGGVLASS